MALIQVNYIYIHTYIAWYFREYSPSLSHHFPIFPKPPVELRRPTELQGMYDAQSRCVGDLGGSPAGNCPRCTARWGPVVCWWSVRWPEARCRLCAQPETTHEDRGTGEPGQDLHISDPYGRSDPLVVRTALDCQDRCWKVPASDTCPVWCSRNMYPSCANFIYDL